MSDIGSFFGGGFDTNSVPPQDDFDVLPPGKYPVLIEKAEVKPTKAGNGYYISLMMTVIDGPFKNRKLWDNINIANPSEKCVEIGLRQLAALGKSIGLQAITDTAELLSKACLAHVKVKDNANEIRTYSSFEDAASVQQPPHGQPQLASTSGQQSQYCPRMPMQNPYHTTSQPNVNPAGNVVGKPPWAR